MVENKRVFQVGITLLSVVTMFFEQVFLLQITQVNIEV